MKLCGVGMGKSLFPRCPVPTVSHQAAHRMPETMELGKDVHKAALCPG